MYKLLVIFIVHVYLSELSVGLPINGCPVWGCRPSGTFSFTLNVPTAKATIDWVSDFFSGPVPNVGGCVGNSENVVCQSNGPGPTDTGYVSIGADSGKVRWRDPVLRFPTLPVMDTHGDIWGSDGTQVVTYDTTGKPMGPKVPLEPNLRPLFDLQVINENILLLVSENGNISLLLTDGTPFASLTLRGTVGDDNGTFIPTAPPIVNDVDSRFYVITEFAPDYRFSTNIGFRRLYSVDTRKTITDRVTVAWYYNFVSESHEIPINSLFFRPSCHRRSLVNYLKVSAVTPTIVWDNLGQLVLVGLPPPLLGASTNVASQFFGIRDYFHDPGLVFKTDMNVTNIALYEANQEVSGSSVQSASNADSQIWVSLPGGHLLAIDRAGTILIDLDLSKVLHADCAITSKVMTARTKDVDADFLIFGIHVSSKTNDFKELVSFLSDQTNIDAEYFIIGYDTSENLAKPVTWMFPVPGNMPVTGQIIGVPRGSNGTRDRIIAFVQNGKAGKMFSVTSK